MSQQAGVSASELRWRCRRGMLELDLLLGDFVKTEYNKLTKDEVFLFSTILDYQDQTLLDLLLGKKVSPDEDVSDLLEKIRLTCRN